MDYSWRTLKEIESNELITDENFWNGISVWIERPHLLNRRLLSAELLSLHYISKLNNRSDYNLNEIITQHFSLNSLTSGTLKNILNNFTLSTELINSKNIKIFEKLLNIKESDASTDLLLIRNLLPRNMKLYQDMAEVSLFDMTQCTAAFYPMTTSALVYPLSPNFPYRFKLSNNKIILEVFQTIISEKSKEECKSEKWLAFEILPKIFKWCKNPSGGPVFPSLNLISAKNYNTNLHHLKEKYGKYYIQIWPEFNNTDPLKYVFEDISICAYLITLWEEERKMHNLRKKQTFVDLGCGNGLLVDILSAEGYEGIGIDVRKRKIWNAFKCSDKLIEMAIEPCNRQLFPDYDWIIGNHPDELTPWIPIVAARSSYEMKIFLMPCCYYSFNGKYSHCDAGLSRYQSYLKYIKNLCESIGFNVEHDKLRIPSTKRICFVCKSRSYEKEEELKIDLHRSDIINSEWNLYQKRKKYCKVADETKERASTDLWLQDFKPREQAELIRNCTDINRKTVNETVLKIANILLHTENILLVKCGSIFVPWNAGGKLKMCDLIKILEPELLQSLKNQHGGLKTLLRNHGNIFEVKEGYVQIKVPVKRSCSEFSTNTRCNSQQKKYNNYKTKKCFFYFNHPQKCPLLSSDCSYLHDE